MAEVKFPVPSVPIADEKTRYATREWRWFFHDILVRIGGLGGVTGLFASGLGVTGQAWDAELDAIAALTPTNSNFIVGNGSTWVAETGATARASLGLVIGTDVQADLAVPSQAEAEAGTATDERVWTAERVKQAIAALESGAGDTLPIIDTTAVVKGSADATKLVRIEADGLATGTTRVLTMPDQDVDLTPGQTFQTQDAQLDDIAALAVTDKR